MFIFLQDLRSKAAALAQEESVSWKRLRPIYMAIRSGTKSLRAANRRQNTAARATLPACLACRESKEKEEGGALLSTACKASKVVLPYEPKKERNPELVARLQKLQRKEEERQYNAMVLDVTAAVNLCKLCCALTLPDSTS